MIKMGRVRLRVRDIDYSNNQSKCVDKKQNDLGGGIAVLNEIEKLDIALNQGGRSSKSRSPKKESNQNGTAKRL